MPTYDYRCEACGHVTEAKRGYTTHAVPCPLCGGNATRLAVYKEQAIRGETVAKGAR